MKYFKLREFACNCCGKNKINRTFVRILSAAREHSKNEDGSDIPFIITSGWRCENHPESIKNPTSSHIKGLAADILVKNSRERAVILGALMEAGFSILFMLILMRIKYKVLFGHTKWNQNI
jgi:hypothetical protein